MRLPAYSRLIPLTGLLLIGWTVSAEEPGGYLGPSTLISSKDGQTLYVACADAAQVAWVQPATGQVTRRVAVPAEPTGLVLSPDGSRLLVTCAAPKSTLVILDVATGQVVQSLSAGHTAGGPSLSADGSRLYLCNRFQNDISVIDLAAGQELLRVPAIREPLASALTLDGRTLLVANHLPNTRTDAAFTGSITPYLTVVDTQTHRTTAIEMGVGANSLKCICLSPDGRYAFVTHLLSNFLNIPFRVDMGWINVNVVSIIDIKQQKVISSIGLDELSLGSGNPWGVACSADGNWVAVSQAGTHELKYITLAELLSDRARTTMWPMPGVWPVYPSLGESLWRKVKLPGKGPRGLAFIGSKAYVAEYFSDTLAVVDLPSAGEPKVSSIALGKPPQLTLQRRGELLFHDATICYQQWQSCASCHPDGRVDSLNWDLMNDGVGNPKNTKSMLLAHRTPPAMAEGVRMTAEEAVRSGIANILFSDRPEAEGVAIDAYLKSLRPVPSPHLVDGHLSVAAARGQKLFESERIACHKCHPGPLYTDLKSHNVGSRNPLERADRFDTPTLVEVWRTAPYLHDGRYLTIKELLVEGQHGLRGGRADGLTDQDLSDLAEYVLSL